MPLDDDPYADVVNIASGAKPPRQPRPSPAPNPASNYEPDTAMDLISKYESGDRNVPNYRYDRTHTAGGHLQITNTNWRNYGPRAGVDLNQYPNAMAAPRALQRNVGKLMYGERGFQDWAPYNPRLRQAINRGEQPQSQDPYGDVTKIAAGNQQPQQQDDPYKDVVNIASGQTPPPQKQNVSTPAVQTATTPAGQSRQPSVPIQQGLKTLGTSRSIPKGLMLPKGQRNAGPSGMPILSTPQQSQTPANVPLDLPEVNKVYSRLPSEMVQAANTPAANERERVRQQVQQDRAGRIGAYGAPTRAGVANLLKHPISSFTGLAQPEEQNVQNEVQQQIDATRTTRRPEVEALTKTYRGLIHQAAQTGQLGPDVQQWANEVVGQSAGLGEYAAAGIRGLSPITAITAQLLGRRKMDADTIALHAAAIAQAAEEEGVNRSDASKLAQHTISGLITTAPEMGMMALGVPPIAAFAGGGMTRAFGRGESPTQIAEAGTQNALQAAPFELPVAQGIGGVKGALLRGTEVGTGTTALGLAQGQPLPEAISGGLQTGIMAGAPEVGREAPRRALIRERLSGLAEAAGPRGEPSERQIEAQPNVAAQPETIESTTRPVRVETNQPASDSVAVSEQRQPQNASAAAADLAGTLRAPFADLGEPTAKVRETPPVEVAPKTTEPVAPEVAKPETSEVPVSEQPKSAGEKQPWEMTQNEFWQRSKEAGYTAQIPNKKGTAWVTATTRARHDPSGQYVGFDKSEWKNPIKDHERAIELAIREGKPVPPEVLADYPDLKRSAEVAERYPEQEIADRVKSIAADLDEGQRASVYGNNPDATKFVLEGGYPPSAESLRLLEAEMLAAGNERFVTRYNRSNNTTEIFDTVNNKVESSRTSKRDAKIAAEQMNEYALGDRHYRPVKPAEVAEPKSVAETVKPTESLAEMRTRHESEQRAIDEPFDALTKDLTRQKGKARTRAAKDALDNQWREAKRERQAKITSLSGQQFREMEAHPEQKAIRANDLKQRDEYRAQEESRTANAEKEQRAADWAKVQNLGGADEILTNLRGQLAKKKGSLARASEANKWKFQSAVDAAERDIAHVEGLQKEFEAEPKSETKPVEPETKPESTYGTRNVLVKQADAEAARARLKALIDPSRLHESTDILRSLPDLAKLGAYHLEAGAREFGAWSANFLQEFQEDKRKEIEPYLRRIYGNAQDLLKGAEKGEPEAAPSGPPPSETTGIAHRVSEAAGIAAERGRGISAEQSTIEGRAKYTEEKALGAIERFENDPERRVSEEMFQQARAHKEALAKITNRAADKFGKDSPEYKAARKAEADWVARIKPLSTEWHKGGAAQQGETEIDTGTFHGLQRAFRDVNSREMRPSEEGRAKRIANVVGEAETKADEGNRNLIEELNKANKVQDLPPEVRKSVQRLIDQSKYEARKEKLRQTRKSLDEEAAVIRSNIAEAFKKIKTQTGVQPLGFARFDPEGIVTKEAIKYAKNRIKAGVTDVAQLVNEVHKVIKEYAPDVSRREISEALAGMGMPKGEKKEVSDFVKAKGEIVAGLKSENQAQALDELKGRLAKGGKTTPEDGRAIWQHMRDKYVDKGVEVSEAIQKTATDLKANPEQIRRAIANQPKAKRITDEMYQRQAARREARQSAEAWVRNADKTPAQRAIDNLTNIQFNLATFGHGTVGPVTHAGENIFHPTRWVNYFKNVGRTWGAAYSPEFHEKKMQDLVNDPLYLTGKRAGLKTEPSKFYDEYQNSLAAKMFGKIGKIGNRGFDMLKTMRQDFFNQRWNKLDESQKTPEMAKVIADLVNHSTGAVNAPFLGKSGVRATFFAAPLEASRWARILGDPIKAINALTKGRDMTAEDKYLVKSVVKSHAEFAATYLAALALNQAVLTATGSDDKVNFRDPSKGDWLRFKVKGRAIEPTGGIIGTIDFLGKLGQAAFGTKPKEGRFDKMVSVAGKYGRGKLSPSAGTGVDVVTQEDYNGRPLPFSSEEKGKYGQPRYTWPEYFLTKHSPIPASEGLRDWFNTMKEQGVPTSTISEILNAAITHGASVAKSAAIGTVSGTTGVKVGEEYKSTAPKVSSKDRVAPYANQVRSGRMDADKLQQLVDKGTISEKEKSEILKQGAMTVQQSTFSEKSPKEAFDSFDRMNPSQREPFREIMQEKAKSLLNSKTEHEDVRGRATRLNKLKQKLDSWGIEYKDVSQNTRGMRQRVQSAFA